MTKIEILELPKCFVKRNELNKNVFISLCVSQMVYFRLNSTQIQSTKQSKKIADFDFHRHRHTPIHPYMINWIETVTINLNQMTYISFFFVPLLHFVNIFPFFSLYHLFNPHSILLYLRSRRRLKVNYIQTQSHSITLLNLHWQHFLLPIFMVQSYIFFSAFCSCFLFLLSCRFFIVCRCVSVQYLVLISKYDNFH